MRVSGGNALVGVALTGALTAGCTGQSGELAPAPAPTITAPSAALTAQQYEDSRLRNYQLNEIAVKAASVVIQAYHGAKNPFGSFDAYCTSIYPERAEGWASNPNYILRNGDVCDIEHIPGYVGNDTQIETRVVYENGFSPTTVTGVLYNPAEGGPGLCSYAMLDEDSNGTWHTTVSIDNGTATPLVESSSLAGTPEQVKQIDQQAIACLTVK